MRCESPSEKLGFGLRLDIDEWAAVLDVRAQVVDGLVGEKQNHLKDTKSNVESMEDSGRRTGVLNSLLFVDLLIQDSKQQSVKVECDPCVNEGGSTVGWERGTEAEDVGEVEGSWQSDIIDVWLKWKSAVEDDRRLGSELENSLGVW